MRNDVKESALCRSSDTQRPRLEVLLPGEGLWKALVQEETTLVVQFALRKIE